MFTFRQLQESVFLKPNTLAISSLLVLMAISCFAYGIPVGYLFNSKEAHVIDYTFEAKEEEVKSVINKLGLNEYIDGIYDMNIGRFYDGSFSANDLISAVENQKNGEDKERLLNNLQYMDRPYLISVTSYNKLLELQGKEQIILKDNEVALYSDPVFKVEDVMENALKERPTLYFDGEEYKLIDKYYNDSIVTDKLITIMYGLIVSEDVFNKYTDENNISTYWNTTLNDGFVKEKRVNASYC